MSCPTPEEAERIKKALMGIDQGRMIDFDKENPLRYNVWNTTGKHLKSMFETLSTKELPRDNTYNSVTIFDKLDGTLQRISSSNHGNYPEQLIEDIIDDETNNIAMSIALYEVMEAVKGESDAAKKAGVNIADISKHDGVLPAIPAARIAAVIGRKVLFQRGVRIVGSENSLKPEEVEGLYHKTGMAALKLLESKKYININENTPTLKSYTNEADQYKSFRDKDKTLVVSNTKAISLNTKTLKIKSGSLEALYFTDRPKSKVLGTRLGAIVDVLSAVRQITQKSQYRIPDVKPVMTNDDYVLVDDPKIVLGKTTDTVRKNLYKKPLKVQTPLHDFLKLLHEEVSSTQLPASKIIERDFKSSNELLTSLFGVKQSDLYSVDKIESIKGQNLSNTTVIDDIAEYYNLLTDDKGNPADLHLALKVGRNERLYYVNSVLNPHASKMSRAMLSPGKQEIDVADDDFDYLVYQIGDFLDGNLTYDEIVTGGNEKLDKALKTFDAFKQAKTLQGKFIKLSHLGLRFPGKDFTVILTALQAIQDVRNPVAGKVITEFPVSSDATASGGVLTFLQASGSNPNIVKFLERIGMLLKEDGSIEVSEGVDVYTLMTEAVDEYVRGDENVIAAGTEAKERKLKEAFNNTLDLLFDNKKKARDFSKAPTMTFVYGQGPKGAVNTITTELADRIIDSLDSTDTKKYLTWLFNNPKYEDMSTDELINISDLYPKIKEGLITSGLPKQVYKLLGIAIEKQFLKEHQERSDKIWNLVTKTANNKVIKIMPADAILDGKKASEDLSKYGMPIAKIFEIMHTLPDGTDVLTRKEILHRTIMDVSTIHGIDSALLYHSLGDAKFEDGVVVVHDQVIGTVKDVRRTEVAYAKKAKEVLVSYDIHEQVLESLKYYAPDIINDPDYKALSNEVRQSMEVKKELAERFNENTSALIGNGDKHVKFAGEDSKTVVGKQDTKKKDAKKSLKVYLENLGEDSDIIQKFVEVSATSVKVGEDSSFNPKLDEITIAINDASDRASTIEAVEHEIIHALTVAQISEALQGKGDKVVQDDVRYFQKTLDALEQRKNKLSTGAKTRLDYINAQFSEVHRIAEFVAVMTSEKAVATEIYKSLDTNSTASRIKAFVDRIKLRIARLVDADFGSDVDIEKLYGALQRTIDKGISDRINRQEEVQNILKGINGSFGFNNKPSITDMDFLNKAVSRFVMDRAEEKGKTILKGIHRELSNYEVYADVVNKLQKIYDSSENFQGVMHTITGAGIDKEKKAFVLAQYAKTTAQRQDFIQKHLSELGNLVKKLSDEDKDTLEKAITKIPLHEYFVRAKDFNTVALIDEQVEILEKDLGKDSTAVKDVNSLVALNVHNKVSGSVYNLQHYGAKNLDGTTTEYVSKIHTLLALKSIQAVGSDKFVNLLKNEELMAKVQAQVTANHLSLLRVGNKDSLRATGIPHSYGEGIQQRVITLEELPMYQYGENLDWEIVTLPTKDTLGLVYRKVIDSTTLPGAFTDIKMSTSDIIIPPGSNAFRNANTFTNVMKTPEGFKMILDDAQRAAMGSLGAIQSLVRSTAHALSIQESQIIRDTLLEQETTFVVNESSLKELNDILADDSKENPWFLKADGIIYQDLPDKVKARYKPVGDRASNVEKFNEEITWVRKDISHWLLGGREDSLLKNTKLQWGIRITKDLISMTKIGMVILNPAKIARDNMSNLAYLGVMGVSPTFIFNNYKEIMDQYARYTSDKNRLLDLKVQLIADPENDDLKSKDKALRSKLKLNPITSIEDKGFLNSLGSALILRESETLGGTQKDIDTALKYLLKQKDGKKNYLGHFLLAFQKAGFQGEDFLIHLGNVVKKAKVGKELENELDKIHERLSHIRSDKDVVAYASQFINSPQSEAVRLGASITDLSDVLAKETYYRHLVNEGMSQAEARIEVLDAFPNYIENMPMKVQQASDLGILMFPTFWLRIQKTIYRMVKDRPLSLAAEEAIETFLGSNLDTVIDANIYNKATSWGGILHSPYEHGIAEAIFPTRVFNF